MAKIQFGTNNPSTLTSTSPPPAYSPSLSLANSSKRRSDTAIQPNILFNSISALDSSNNTTATAVQSISATHIHRIIGVRLPRRSPQKLYDILLTKGKIAEVSPHNPRMPSLSHLPGILLGNGRLIAPSLCHAHIHLDKCFLLSDPAYSDLSIQHGTFDEAMSLTQQAKARFTHDDLLRRGRRLVLESLRAGVTAMRAFVEVDATVEMLCLDAGIELQEQFRGLCEIQLCAFAQVPLFSGTDGGDAARKLMREAAKRGEVAVVGSAPYVEAEEVKARMNVRWLAGLAKGEGKALDFHLDYFGIERQPMVHDVVSILKSVAWVEQRSDTQPVCLGHCTRLARWTPAEWRRLKEQIEEAKLDVSFVGLPTSDLFMMKDKSTLNPVELVRDHQLNAAIAVNNVGNAFTPQGSCDPITVASLGVGLYSAGTKFDASLLYNCVSSRAKSAIGLDSIPSPGLHEGQPADFVLFGSGESDWTSPRAVTDVVYNPGAVSNRQIISAGRLLNFSR
ncbi:Metallo-dependent hydrolase [Eremomyces bilateralis CBS 781.70]|uniref:Metallo-dependent hydrolase n=1 Tax=Eremomyces bilateralis CBS 781.70 TaxID=1392243 RepID=A0A6G1G2P9_9PEZI|nr:Metallo-dependent hydrolase [Eremomyces bilateralis CBS 781.70]KAF1812262.1 Metallo-dependent hydrolase [Eremomyces bilateralis CBS 781.70]